MAETTVTYKAIGFDYGGVIGGAGKTGGAFSEAMCSVLGMSREAFREEYFKVNSLINEGRLDDWRSFWELFLKNIGQPEKIEQVMAVSNQRDTEHFMINQPVLDMVDELRGRGYRLGLLSNNTKANGVRLREMGVDTHFDVFHISAETGYMKPRPEAFQHFVDELGVKFPELIFIDDSVKSLSTAEECGFAPVLFTSYDALRQELQTLDIL